MIGAPWPSVRVRDTADGGVSSRMMGKARLRDRLRAKVAAALLVRTATEINRNSHTIASR